MSTDRSRAIGPSLSGVHTIISEYFDTTLLPNSANPANDLYYALTMFCLVPSGTKVDKAEQKQLASKLVKSIDKTSALLTELSQQDYFSSLVRLIEMDAYCDRADRGVSASQNPLPPIVRFEEQLLHAQDVLTDLYQPLIMGIDRITHDSKRGRKKDYGVRLFYTDLRKKFESWPLRKQYKINNREHLIDFIDDCLQLIDPIPEEAERDLHRRRNRVYELLLQMEKEKIQ